MLKILISFLIAFLFVVNVYSANISGIVSNEEDEPLSGVTVQIKSLSLGSKTDKEGKYALNNIPKGKYIVEVKYISYKTILEEVIIDKEDLVINFNLEVDAVNSKTVDVVSSRATFRQTPIAYSELTKEDLNQRLGSRDVPMILNETPGVYATMSGGGFGDSRINIRGFSQRNIAVMINGVPVNDMENGSLFWSNWDGIGDVTSLMQVQRGLGAGKLANPSVGGTINILTDPAFQKQGFKFKQEISGSQENNVGEMFKKTTLAYNTGKIGDFSASVLVNRRTSDGIVDKTYLDAWTYYVGLSYDISDKHQVDLYLFGAPQEHGQRSFRQPIALYDTQKAQDLGISLSPSSASLNNKGVTYNQHWGYYDNAKYSKEFYNGKVQDSYYDNKLNERVNYYNKPQVNLNWHWQLDEKSSLTNVFYFSQGVGGGSGPAGPTHQIDFTTMQINYNAIDAGNQAIDRNYNLTDSKSTKVLLNSINSHYWTGWLGTYELKPMKGLTVQAGTDLRYYEGIHYREVRNLIGGDYYIETIRNSSGAFVDSVADLNVQVKINELFSKKNRADSLEAFKLRVLKLGDKLQYNYNGYVNWLGAFAQTEYKFDEFTTFINISGSNTRYKREDLFRTTTSPNGNVTDWQTFSGYTAKIGGNYNISSEFNIYTNIGYYNRAPFFNSVFANDNGLYDNILNEKISAFELGMGYRSREFIANLNVYNTNWKDRSVVISQTGSDGTLVRYNLAGLNALHQGVELDVSYRPIREVRIRVFGSVNNWQWTNDVESYYTPENSTQEYKQKIFTKGLKVGDAPQTSGGFNIIAYPTTNLNISLGGNFFGNHYSDFVPENRSAIVKNQGNSIDSIADRQQSWKIPNYFIANLHINYRVPLHQQGFDLMLVANVFNLLDAVYIADGTDNRLGKLNAEGTARLHDAANAEVIFGAPRNFNFGIQIKY